MAKIYVKTIALTCLFVLLFLMRFGLLVYALPIPVSISNFLLFTLITAIIINEKLTRGEHWKKWHYTLLFILMIFYAIVFIELNFNK